MSYEKRYIEAVTDELSLEWKRNPFNLLNFEDQHQIDAVHKALHNCKRVAIPFMGMTSETKALVFTQQSKMARTGSFYVEVGGKKISLKNYLTRKLRVTISARDPVILVKPPGNGFLPYAPLSFIIFQYDQPPPPVMTRAEEEHRKAGYRRLYGCTC